MVLTRSQTPIYGIAYGRLLDGTFVKIYIESKKGDTNVYKYKGGNFYVAKKFIVNDIKSTDLNGSSKMTRYSGCLNAEDKWIEYGLNVNGPMLFFDK